MTNTRNVTWCLPEDLVITLENMAAIQGTTTQEMVSSLLSQAVQQGVVPGHGRCSLRTGLHSEGPRPLPLQQP